MGEIKLAAGRGVVLVDDADLPLVSSYRWYFKRRSDGVGAYAVAIIKRPDGRLTTIRMHKLLLPGASEVDHRNGDGLDNRRSNLRYATRAQNNHNSRKLLQSRSSRFKGVSWHRGKWWARIRPGGGRESRSLGLYHDEEEAARAYDQAARELFGEYASTNF